MGLFSISNVGIDGLATVVPQNVYDNLDYDWIPEKDRKKLIQTTGIAQRRYVDEGVTTSDLCEKAVNELLNKLEWERTEIDLLVFVSQMRDYIVPNTATILQHKLGLSKNCAAFDIPLGCSGYVYGLSVVASMIQSGVAKKALLLVGDATYRQLSYQDKTTFPLFGDAGSATALSYKEEVPPMFFNLQTDGEGYQAIIAEDGGTRNPANADSLIMQEIQEGVIRNKHHVALDGLKIFEFAVSEVPGNIKKLLRFAEQDKDSIDYFVFHQANKLMNETLRKFLKIPVEKYPYSLENFGNTSSASIPLSINYQIHQQASKEKLKFLLSGFGVGLSWGSLILETAPFLCLPLIEY